jgi:glycosyltransferase involved in cell wall biosynthesis
MEISLVIPAFNEEKYIGDTLESVLAHAGGAFKEIIVVDNASTDRTGAIAARYPGVTVVREDRKGTGFAREAGFRAATAPLIAFLDADTRMRDGWVGLVCRAFERDPGLACVTGPYWFYDLPPLTRALLWVNWHFAPIGNLFTGTLVVGGNFAIRRSVLERMGGFDTSIVFHGDDIDIGVRAARFGTVKLSFALYLDSSGRRYRAAGAFTMVGRYIYNGFVGGFLRRKQGYTAGYEEVR